MNRKKPLEVMVRAMSEVMTRVPLTLKMRTGVYADKRIAHTIIPQVINQLRDINVLVTYYNTANDRYSGKKTVRLFLTSKAVVTSEPVNKPSSISSKMVVFFG